MHRVSKKEFLERSIQKHGNRYNYFLSVFKNCETKIDIVCSKHGIFKQTPEKHMAGQGCPRCALELFKYNQLTTDSFIEKAKVIHNNFYDYSLVNYIRSNIKVKIKCPKHGIFEQTPNNHIRGMRCVKCSNEENSKKRRSSTVEFIDKARKTHGNKYDYSLVEYIDSKSMIKILCPVHGIFFQIPRAHLNHRGCPACHESRGERKIIIILESYGIKFIRQETFGHQCRNIKALHFDFFLPDYNTCIEYDGKQHFFPIIYFGGIPAFEQLKKLDRLKGDFCLKNRINLIRISYKEKYSDIKNILKIKLGLSNNYSSSNSISTLPIKDNSWEMVQSYLETNGYITNQNVREIVGLSKSYMAYQLLSRWIDYGRILKMECSSRKLTRYYLPHD